MKNKNTRRRQAGMTYGEALAPMRLRTLSLACIAALGAPVAWAQTVSNDNLPTVTVIAAPVSGAAALQSEGKAADGYRVKSASSVGALTGDSLLDLPYSISVVSADLIKNTQAMSPDDIFKLNPFTRTIAPQGAGWSPVVAIRGFNTSDRAEDGLRRSINFVQVVEDKERVEVLNGLSGFMYGAGSPAGMINYVYKRPTTERLNEVTAGNYGGNQYYLHGDFGGRIDEAGRLGYRLNVVKQDGGTVLDYQKIDRTLVSGALDWHVTDKLLLEFNAVYNKYKTTSPTAYWAHAVNHTVVPDATKNWSQKWIYDEFENTSLTAKATYNINEHITVRGVISRSDVDRPVQDHTINYVTAPGSYSQLRQRAGETKFRDDAAQLLADVRFNTGPLAHKITTGYYAYTAKNWGTTYSPSTGYVGSYSMSADPVYVNEFNFGVNNGRTYFAGKSTNQNFLLGDEVKLANDWTAMVGINHSEIKTENFNALGAKSQADYNQSRNSPTVSLLYKPLPVLTIYASYLEGLEMGGRAPTSATNRGTIMAPMVSKQKELGAKAEVGGVLLTTALFEIEKAYEFLDSGNTYTQDGRQRHKGWEVGVSGKPTRNLALIGGMTVLDTKIKGGTNNGLKPINVADFTAKLFAEYNLPLPGLAINGGVYYTGPQWGNTLNTDRLSAYTTFDVGARYELTGVKYPVTLRLNVNNLTGKNYWANSYYTGAPRTVAFSASTRF